MGRLDGKVAFITDHVDLFSPQFRGAFRRTRRVW